MSLACLFPGQGSQSKGMGAGLFERFADWTSIADRVLGYSIRDLCIEDAEGRLVQTAFTQPALFVVNAMTYRARLESGAEAPRFVAGHSLGEYNALLAAGVFDFETGLRFVRERGALMGRVGGGG
ncbi:MAG TPA: acyltransferase domain-containing protein, partial [Vicinamibacterales bacterium]|nr:acyltransferase domain-containing protein [Vicinamibacterales bacterium]